MIWRPTQTNLAKYPQTGHKEVLFNAAHAKHTPPIARPIEEQEERESQRLWQTTVKAIKESNHVAATEEKSKIEDRQRDETAKRAEQGIDWQPKLFRRVQGGPGGHEEGEEDLDWILNADMYVWMPVIFPLLADFPSDGATPQEKVKQILSIAPILIGQSASQVPNAIPSQHAHQSSQHPPQTQNKPTGNSDLIDFGQADTAPASAIPERNSSLQQMKQQIAPPGLQEPLMPGAPLRRVDTATNELDEFVDAKP